MPQQGSKRVGRKLLIQDPNFSFWPRQDGIDMLEMLRVTEAGDIDSVAALARDIWAQHFIPIIGQEQTDYMLAKFQSAPAIAQQIVDGYHYYIVIDAGHGVGYFAIVPCPAERSAQLSKIYVRRERRGRGFGKVIMAFVERRCIEMGIRDLWLTVNRHNASSIAFYRHVGFTRSGDLVQDIGNGFVMDDYKMVKMIGQRTNAA
jgi:GNAT superfamily N-acetyltransferase